MSDDIKYIDIKEFRERGYLQEANRQFLHPLGLALCVAIDDETGEETLGGVWDYREDPEGIYFAPEVLDSAKCRIVVEERKTRDPVRLKQLGYVEQPVGT